MRYSLVYNFIGIALLGSSGAIIGYVAAGSILAVIGAIAGIGIGYAVALKMKAKMELQNLYKD